MILQSFRYQRYSYQRRPTDAPEQRDVSTTLSKQINYGVTVTIAEEASLNKRRLYRRVH